MSALVNPGLTSASFARATHQLGAALAYLPLLWRRLRLGLTAGGSGAWLSPEPRDPFAASSDQLESRRRDEGELGALPHQRHQPHRIDLRLRSEL